ncbi:MAG: TraB/GumN family protein [Candidatus Omnitrophica bacterium]|nr:TraB/GumN family protein [Candidatus Omnitrophota bacterium]
MDKKTLLNCLLAALITCAGLLFPAQCPAQQRPLSGQKCFLWQVSSGNNSIYLLGSIHMGRPDMFPLNERIEQAFKSCQKLAVEVNIAAADALNNPDLLSESSLYPGEETLKGNLSERTYALAREKLQQLMLPMELVEKFRPWFVAMLLEQLELLNLGFDPMYGIDVYFLDKAGGAKQILELESLEFQINLFNQLSNSQQDAFLYSTLLSLDNMGQTMDEMVTAWVNGDTQAMSSLLAKTNSDDPQLIPVYQKIIYERNINMADKAEGYLRNGGSCFVVVGAAHLLGPNGIVELLRQRGYKVEQL